MSYSREVDNGFVVVLVAGRRKVINERRSFKRNKYQSLFLKKWCIHLYSKKTFERRFSLDNNYSYVQAPYRGVFPIFEATIF